jgi:putrescine importer
MGQDGAIPKKFFGQVSRRNRIPSNNVIMIGVICLAGALLISYERGAELLNYGALLAFMGVNLSSAVLGWRQGRGAQWFWILISLLGFAVCLFIWLNLHHQALIVGTLWAVFGVIVWLLHGRRARLLA